MNTAQGNGTSGSSCWLSVRYYGVNKVGDLLGAELSSCTFRKPAKSFRSKRADDRLGMDNENL